MISEKQISFGGGIDTLSAVNALKPDAVADAVDVYISADRLLRQRWGTQVLATGATGSGLFVHAPPGVDPYFVAVNGGHVQVAQIGGEWLTVGSDISLSDVPHGFALAPSAGGSWLTFCFGPSEPLLAVNPVDSTATYTVGSTDVTLCPRYATYWQGRLWIAGEPTLEDDSIAWSAVWAPQNFLSYQAQNVRVDPANGGRITALVPGRSEEPLLYVFKESAIYAFQVYWQTDGWIPSAANTLDTTQSRIRPLSYRIGCVAPLSAMWVPSAEAADLYFLAADGVRSLRRSQEDVILGGIGRPLSYKIQAYIDRINWSCADRAVAAVYQNQYILAVPLDGASWPTHVLVKNLHTDPYAGWTVWDIAPRSLATRTHAQQHLYIQEAARVSEYSDDVQTTATMTIVTRAYDFRAPEQRKRWRWLELYYSIEGSGATLSVETCSDDSGTWNSLDSAWVDNSGAEIRLPAALPWKFGQEKIYVQKFPLEEVDPSYMIQFRIRVPADVMLRRLNVVAQVLPWEWI